MIIVGKLPNAESQAGSPELEIQSEPQNHSKANRRISNIEPQNFEMWNRCAQSFFKNK